MRIHFSSFAILFTVSKSSAGDDISIAIVYNTSVYISYDYRKIKRRVREKELDCKTS